VTSYWLEEPANSFGVGARGPVDVAIVGGGVTGCSCALALASGGLRVRVHEAREIASGASGRNGGFALRGTALPYTVAREQLGADRAAGLWRLTERCLDRMADLAGDAFRRVGSLKLAADEGELAELRAEYEALGKDGFDVEWVDDLGPQLARLDPAGLRHPTDGALQPARWVRRLAAEAAAAGAELAELSRVESLDELDAEQVVIATDGRWSGIFGRTADGLPLVGQVPGHDGVWVAAGYSGHGNVLGLACGELVAQAILGSPAPELAIFEPARLL
jgi:glycine/D-amino acid oxidase-like deaminating enzyme